MCSAHRNSIFKHGLKIASYKLQKHCFQRSQAVRDTHGGRGAFLIFESNEFIVVKQLTSLLKLTTSHEHLNEFYNQDNVMYIFHIMFFTFSNISKTLIICSIKQKPSIPANKFIVYSMRNTDDEGN